MSITVIVKRQTPAEERYRRAIRKYSAAVQTLTGARGGSLSEALMVAHQAHIEMLAAADARFRKVVPIRAAKSSASEWSIRLETH
jgi:hypothetical protein